MAKTYHDCSFFVSNFIKTYYHYDWVTQKKKVRAMRPSILINAFTHTSTNKTAAICYNSKVWIWVRQFHFILSWGLKSIQQLTKKEKDESRINCERQFFPLLCVRGIIMKLVRVGV